MKRFRPRRSETALERVTTTAERRASEDATAPAWQAGSPAETWTDSLGSVKQLVEMGAVAVKLPECFYQRASIEQPFGPVLLTLDEAVKKLASAREIVRVHGMDIGLFACTEARRAMAVHSDRDSRDRKYLSGTTYCGVLHTYCGGLDAAISRALIYAPQADVICFKSDVSDVSEAKRFAAALQGAFPEKQLAFGYSPKPDGPKWNEFDHTAFQSELYSIGFVHYFFTQFGTVVFPQFPSIRRWVMFDDALENSSFGGSVSHSQVPFRRCTEQS
ncbi:MAG: hypothetical protein ABI076_01790 [Acidobacteriaceae bacterium]